MDTAVLIISVAALLWWAELALEWWMFARKGMGLADLPAPLGKVSLSVIVPARNEGQNLEKALLSLLEALPAAGEVFLVNDRSTDATSNIGHRLASRDPRLRVVDVKVVPEGWLGKTHAMQVGYGLSSGKYLLFTDADVLFKPGCLEPAVWFCQREGIDHLVATPRMVTEGFWERTFVLFFSILLVARYRIWRAPIRASRSFAGIGAFNLVSRIAYERAGTHMAIRNEVVDDLLLGRLIKRSGGKQYVLSGESCLQVRWHEGLSGLVKGLEKNAYAGFGFSPARTLSGCVALILITILPALLPFLRMFIPWNAVNGALTVTGIGVWFCFALLYSLASRALGTGGFYFLTFPIGSMLLVWTIIRSMALYHIRGGVRWRGTTYKSPRTRE